MSGLMQSFIFLSLFVLMGLGIAALIISFMCWGWGLLFGLIGGLGGLLVLSSIALAGTIYYDWVIDDKLTKLDDRIYQPSLCLRGQAPVYTMTEKMLYLLSWAPGFQFIEDAPMPPIFHPLFRPLTPFSDNENPLLKVPSAHELTDEEIDALKTSERLRDSHYKPPTPLIDKP